MTRRPLRSIDPALDLSRYLVGLPRLAPAVIMDESQPGAAAGRVTLSVSEGSCGSAFIKSQFQSEAPTEVEVGTGKGLFLAAAAAQDPAANYLGIEIIAKYARFAAAKLAQRGLSNAKVIHGDALRVFRELIPAESLRAVHVYFPDPWWKARHKKRRVINERFLKEVERTLIPDGRFHFWTDVEEYFQTTRALVAEHTRLAGPFPVSEKPADHDLDYRTHFERRTRLHNQPVYRAEFSRV